MCHIRGTQHYIFCHSWDLNWWCLISEVHTAPRKQHRDIQCCLKVYVYIMNTTLTYWKGKKGEKKNLTGCECTLHILHPAFSLYFSIFFLFNKSVLCSLYIHKLSSSTVYLYVASITLRCFTMTHRLTVIHILNNYIYSCKIHADRNSHRNTHRSFSILTHSMIKPPLCQCHT